MSTDEDVVALIRQGDDLSALEFRLGREQRAEEMGRQDTEGCAEVVEDQFGPVVGWVSVAGEFLSLDPIPDGEGEHWSVGQMDDGESGRTLLVLLQDDDGCVVPVRGEGADFA